MLNILKHLYLIFFVILFSSSCASNKKLVIHHKDEITNAPVWEQKFIKSDSLTGIKIEIEKGSTSIHLKSWREPVDTIVTVTHTKNFTRSLPDFGKYDLTEYRVSIKKEWDSAIFLNFDSNNKSVIVNVEPGSYFIEINSIGYNDIYIKNVIVQKQTISVIEVSMIGIPDIEY
jgi:hypothetical protein